MSQRLLGRAFERFAVQATEWTGRSSAFVLASVVVVVWMATGPWFHYSDTWQLVINTGTTIVTFLMVFLIQRAQNKDAKAIQLKLNEIVSALRGASNRLIDIEDLSEDELEVLHQHYQRIASQGRSGSPTYEPAASGVVASDDEAAAAGGALRRIGTTVADPRASG